MNKIVLLFGLFVFLFYNCRHSVNPQQVQVELETTSPWLGKWMRLGHSGPIVLNFKDNGTVEGDFGNNQVIDLVAKYDVEGDTIIFIDEQGHMCEGVGQYKLYFDSYYLSFDLIDDNCGGRIKATMGFWTRPQFESLLDTLTAQIKKASTPDLYLQRGRVYLATGRSDLARNDLDKYILSDTANAKVYLNRAGTKFPGNMEGVILDCNKVLSLDSNSKNAYFLRGLAKYQLGQEEEGCADFSKAIELGFTVLKVAEQEKCYEFWSNE